MNKVLTDVMWRKSTFSGDSSCVEFAALPNGAVAVRDSKQPEDGALLFTRAEINALVQGAKAGEFDDLT